MVLYPSERVPAVLLPSNRAPHVYQNTNKMRKPINLALLDTTRDKLANKLSLPFIATPKNQVADDELAKALKLDC